MTLGQSLIDSLVEKDVSKAKGAIPSTMNVSIPTTSFLTRETLVSLSFCRRNRAAESCAGCNPSDVWVWPIPAATSGLVPLHAVNTLCHRKRSATSFAKETTISDQGWNLVCAFTQFFRGNTSGHSQFSGAIGGLLSTYTSLESLAYSRATRRSASAHCICARRSLLSWSPLW